MANAPSLAVGHGVFAKNPEVLFSKALDQRFGKQIAGTVAKTSRFDRRLDRRTKPIDAHVETIEVLGTNHQISQYVE